MFALLVWIFLSGQIFEDGRLSHFIDGRGASGNWMSLVNSARFPEEQNLTALQCQGQIYYESCKEISPGQELLVWYGDCYLQFLGIPISLKGPTEGKRAQQHSEGQGATWRTLEKGEALGFLPSLWALSRRPSLSINFDDSLCLSDNTKVPKYFANSCTTHGTESR